MTSLLDVQESLDSMVLAFFETARAYEQALSQSVNGFVVKSEDEKYVTLSSEKSTELNNLYEKVKNSIIHLKGIDLTEAQQQANLALLREEYSNLRSEIIELDSDLRNISMNIDNRLEMVSSCDKFLCFK
jgi:hypothetical protein